VDDRALVDLELDPAALDLADGALEVECDRPGLRVGHKATPAEDAPESTDLAHHVGRRERDVELEPAGLDPLDQIVAADLVGAGAQRLLRLVALGEHRDPDDLAGAVRSTTVPRTIWSAWRGSTPSRRCASTDGSKLTVEVCLTRSAASPG
jgi:hypothetical protein